MKNIKLFLFKYHKIIGIILCIPLLLTAITGVGMIIFGDMLHNRAISHMLKEIHTGEALGIEEIYSILTGVGLIWLIISGLGVSGLFRKRVK